MTLVDPVPHTSSSRRGERERIHATLEARLGTAGDLPADDERVDAVLLLGPLYHLVDPADRLAALNEAK